MKAEQLLSELSESVAKATEVSLQGYKNGHNEVANFTIDIRSYKSVLEESLIQLEELHPEKPTDGQAKVELIESCKSSLAALAKKRDDEYKYPVEGVKIHRESGDIFLYGLVKEKNVIEAGKYPVMKHSTGAMAKNIMRRGLQLGKFRQFKIVAGNVDKIVVGEKSLVVE